MTVTCLSVSLIRAKGDTEPGVSLSTSMRRSGDAKLSLLSASNLARFLRSTRFSAQTVTR